MRYAPALPVVLACVLFQAACFAEAPPDPPANDAILDAAAALGNPGKNAMRSSIAALFKGAGIPLGIVTLPGRRGYVGSGQDDGAFALALLDAWHGKQPERRWDRGVVVVFFKAERSFWIQSARGLARSPTMRDLIDASAESMKVGFRTGKYAKVIEDGAARFCKDALAKKDAIEKERTAQPEMVLAAGGAQAPFAPARNAAVQTTVHFVPKYESAEGNAVAALWLEYCTASDDKDPKRQLSACDRILNTTLSTDLARWETEFYRRYAWYNKACAHAVLGQVDAAFAALKAAMKMGYDDFKHMETDTDLDSLRADARYAEFMKEAGGFGAAQRTLRGVCVAAPTPGGGKSQEDAWLLKIDQEKEAVPGATQIMTMAPDSSKDAKAFWEKIRAFAANKTPVVVDGTGGTGAKKMIFTVTSIEAAE